MGAGRTELLSALYGAGPRGRWREESKWRASRRALATIAAARRAGLAFVTDDRRGSGLILRHSVGRNVVMSILRRISPIGFMSRAAEDEAAARSIKTFDIRPPRAAVPVGNLSGGNQQKVVFAKELLQEPRLLLLDEPTRGVDVGAKGEIYQRLRALTKQGLGVLVASSELPELIGLCDRIIVMRQGRSNRRIPRRRRRADSAGERDGESPRRRHDGRGERQSPEAAKPVAKARDPLALVVRFQSVIGLVLVLIGGVVFSPVRHGQIIFLSPDNIANIIRAISETGIIALGMTFVIITAGIDLSVGAMLGLNSVLTAMLMTTTNFGLVPTLLVGAAWPGRRSARCRA